MWREVRSLFECLPSTFALDVMFLMVAEDCELSWCILEIPYIVGILAHQLDVRLLTLEIVDHALLVSWRPVERKSVEVEVL